jgi:multidrug efflux pump subunit AcrA (membrane-fusion protein)
VCLLVIRAYTAFPLSTIRGELHDSKHPPHKLKGLIRHHWPRCSNPLVGCGSISMSPNPASGVSHSVIVSTRKCRFLPSFPNPKGLLRHGQSGTVVIRESLKGAVVVPQRATFEDRGQRYVYVVGKDDVAQRREVVVRAELDDIFVVAREVGASDRIVVEGVRQVRDGEKVEYELRPPGGGIGSPRGPGEQ